MSLQTSIYAVDSMLYPQTSRWKVILNSGKELTENELVFDFRRGGMRQLDWALDLITTGDILKIKELWLITPEGHDTVHQGTEVVPIKFDITEPGTAFQLKYATQDFLAGSEKVMQAQCIGKVLDKENGTCDCWIWDRLIGVVRYKSTVSTIQRFGAWRDGQLPIGNLSHDVVGLRLG